MRNRYLVCYDVSDPKRLERVFKKMRGFGEHVQYSVFVCDLAPSERVQLEEALTEVMNLRQDRALILDAGPTEGRGKDCFTVMGAAKPLPSRGPVVV